jgi:hypothetical protein
MVCLFGSFECGGVVGYGPGTTNQSNSKRPNLLIGSRSFPSRLWSHYNQKHLARPKDRQVDGQALSDKRHRLIQQHRRLSESL